MKVEKSPEMAPRKTVYVVPLLLLLLSPPAFAFPPYRSTDAETAEPWVLEVRLGLLRVERERSDTTYSSPLLRLNLGLPRNLELVNEFEYRTDRGEAADAASGLKWVPCLRAASLGIETIALLPVADGSSGTGVESQLLLTVRRRGWRAHVNAGGFYDARPADSEAGWRSSVLTELPRGRFRPGLELFFKQTNDGPVQVSAGSGIIFDAGPFDLRLGLETGITGEATDLRASVWIARAFPLR